MQRSRTFRRWTPLTTFLPPPPQAGLPPRSRVLANMASGALPILLRAGRFARARLPLATGSPPPAVDPIAASFDTTAAGAQYNTRLDN